MTATICTVGDELLIGQVPDGNARWIGEHLTLAGVAVERMVTVGDDVSALREAIAAALAHSDVVVITGGLGPTHDDVTKAVVAEVLGCPLVPDADVLARITEKFEARGRPMPASNASLAEVPEGFEVLDNARGTAPGLWGTTEVSGRARTVVMLPGVPYEMQALMDAYVLPRLREQRGATVAHRTLLTVGQGESQLAERIGSLDECLGPDVRLAFLPELGVVRLRLTAHGDDEEAARQRVEAAAGRLRSMLGDRVFGEGAETLEGVVGGMLAVRGLSVALAESCTGGAVTARLTRVPGASRYLRGGLVAYSNAVKRSPLGVEEKTLREHGAVSRAAAREMAERVREMLPADCGLAVTGVAGPTGGTPDKPVGTVWLAYADAGTTYATHLQLVEDREINIGLSTTAALDLLRRQLLRRDVDRKT